jgi:hypothetical protein
MLSAVELSRPNMMTIAIGAWIWYERFGRPAPAAVPA